ncbi:MULTISPECIES: DUF982 domain-containing protein [unclassified Mesorhizobium]|uniref:DUF982 domain-containing protein n=2 Tax=Mesorhizobium TaxID=68287 RepID=UPI0004121FC8|nr:MULTISPECIES: DUF982 domain-containing protein [unclassified Mesorhizobium]
MIGLTTVQSDYVARARDELLSGEPDQLRAYLNRKRRDKRFDRTITTAIRDGKPIPTNLVARIIGRYSDSLLKLRADTIGLHETFAALGASKDIAFQQAIAKGAVRAESITKGWKHTPQDHPRVQRVVDADNSRLDRFIVIVFVRHRPSVSDSGARNSQRCNHCLVFAFSRLQSWRATKMPAFIPITIYLNDRSMLIASIPDAETALQQPWPFMDKPSRLEAIRMIEECLAGHCTQQAAFDAFRAAASEQGLLKRKPPSIGLRKFDGVAEDLL